MEQSFNDVVTSIVRTIVPLIWGNVVALALVQIPVLESVADSLESLGQILALVVVAVFYAGMRALEPRMPQWLRRIVFGSSTEPHYQEQD